MVIGIDASRAFLKRRTGIEEYSYQVIKHLRQELASEQVVLYIRSDQEVDFELPEPWRVKKLWAPRFWTQIRLSWEMFFSSPDVLFVPAHTVPIIHPKRTIVTVHGLEYEFCPQAYSFWGRFYMRFSIRFSCHVASTVLCVSENTKRDVANLYGVSPQKMQVIYEGCSLSDEVTRNQKLVTRGIQKAEENNTPVTNYKLPVTAPYLLFIGRLEERKNIVRIIEAFEILKEKYHIPHALVLVGKPGFGYEATRNKLQETRYTGEIVELGYVNEEEKWELLQNADVFLFPTLYEGFGIPVLEAQSVGVPVVTSRISSLPEVGGAGAVYCDPLKTESIVEAIYTLVSNTGLRGDILEKAAQNIKRFSWAECAREIACVLRSDGNSK